MSTCIDEFAGQILNLLSQKKSIDSSIDIQLFLIGRAISSLPLDGRIQLGDRFAVAPKDAAPGTLASLGFKNTDNTVPLSELIKIKPSKFHIRLRKGGEKWAQRQVDAVLQGDNDVNLHYRVLITWQRVARSWPMGELVGTTKTGQTPPYRPDVEEWKNRYMYKYYWEQVAYTSYLETLLSPKAPCAQAQDTATSATAEGAPDAGRPAAAGTRAGASVVQQAQDAAASATAEGAPDAGRPAAAGTHAGASVVQQGEMHWSPPNWTSPYFGQAADHVRGLEDMQYLLSLTELDREMILADRLMETDRQRAVQWVLQQAGRAPKRSVQPPEAASPGDSCKHARLGTEGGGTTTRHRQASTFRGHSRQDSGSFIEGAQRATHPGGATSDTGTSDKSQEVQGGHQLRSYQTRGATKASGQTNTQHDKGGPRSALMARPSSHSRARARRRRRSPDDAASTEGPSSDDEDDDYPTTSGGMYTVTSEKDIPGALAKWGVALLRKPELADTLTDGVRQEVEELAKKATPIFKSALLDTENKLVDEIGSDGAPTGFFESNYGSRKRRQVRLEGEVLKDFRGIVEPIVTEVMTLSCLDDPYLNKPTLLVNVQPEGRRPVGRQGWHTDLKEGENGFVAIAPLEDATLLVFPESQKVVEEFWRLDDMVDNGDIPHSDLVTWLQMRSFKPLRLQLTAGSLVFLDGHTVHAGDRGTDQAPCHRIHWYVTAGGKPKANATTHLVEYGAAFAASFH